MPHLPHWMRTPLLLALTATVAARASRVLNLKRLYSRARPVHSYAEAVARIEFLRANVYDPKQPIKQECRTRLLTHGRKMRRVIVLLHGFTNCPKQFDQFGQLLFDKGYNVLIPRTPYQGLADYRSMRKLLADDLAIQLDDVIDVAQGLGDEVIVCGLSGGGTMATWAAQFRSDVDRAVIIAPLLGLPFAPISVVYAAVLALMILPDFWIWWDPIKRDRREWGVPHAYPGFSSHAMAQTMRLGASALRRTLREKPAARSIVLVTIPNDASVSNLAAGQLLERWRANGGSHISSFEFDEQLGLQHDCIDPAQTWAKVDAVYPVLIRLIDAPIL